MRLGAMLHEVSITPDVFEEWRTGDDPEQGIELRELLNDLAENGLVADLDKGKFRALVGDFLKADEHDCPRIATRRAELMSRLNRLHDRKRLVRHPLRSNGHPTSNVDWLDLALESHHRFHFDWMIVGEELREAAKRGASPTAERVASPGEARASEHWPRGIRTETMRMCASGYKPVLGPVLRHAKRLEIVDPYMFRENARRLHFVELCATLMGNRGHAPLGGEIHIHTSEGTDPGASVEDSLNAWTKSLAGLKGRPGSRHLFKVFVWQSKANGPRMHDRFLLTDQCGILSGNGFDCWEDDTVRETTWSLLDAAAWTERRTDLVPNGGPFKCLGERVVK